MFPFLPTNSESSGISMPLETSTGPLYYLCQLTSTTAVIDYNYQKLGLGAILIKDYTKYRIDYSKQLNIDTIS